MSFEFESEEERAVALALGFVLRPAGAAATRVTLRFPSGATAEAVLAAPDTRYALDLFHFTLKRQRDLSDCLAQLRLMTAQRERERAAALEAVRDAASAP